MGCSKTPSADDEEDLDDYDERYDFYNFRSKGIVKNLIPPSKKYSENDNNFAKSRENMETRNMNEEKFEENKKEKNNSNKGSENKEKQNYGKSIKNNSKERNEKNNQNKRDCIHTKNNPNKIINKLNEKNDNNKDKKFNGDIYEILNNNETNNLKNRKNKNNINERYVENNNNVYNSNNIIGNYHNNMDMSYKNIFSENGKAIQDYEKNIEEEKRFEKEENKNNLKRSKLNGITIVENLKEYFPENITKEDIQNLVFEAFGDSIVDDNLLYIPGQTVTYEQAIELSSYIYRIIKNKEVKNEKCLENLNIKIDLVQLNKNLIKEKMFKGKEPSDRELENVYQSFAGESKDIKVLTIEFQ